MINVELIDELAAELADPMTRTGLSAAVPPALSDQIVAAANEQIGRVLAAADALGLADLSDQTDYRHVAIAFLLAGQCHPCEHLRANRGDGTAQPAYATPALGELLCAECLQARMTAETEALLDLDTCCDICGHCDDDQLLWMSSMTLGPALITFGTCDRCADRYAMRPPVRVGRNESCPCGSGHKFKRCHGTPTRGTP